MNNDSNLELSIIKQILDDKETIIIENYKYKDYNDQDIKKSLLKERKRLEDFFHHFVCKSEYVLMYDKEFDTK